MKLSVHVFKVNYTGATILVHIHKTLLFALAVRNETICYPLTIVRVIQVGTLEQRLP